MTNLHRSRALDVIRGIAILGVVVGHYFYRPLSYRWPTFADLIGLGGFGVDLFFVLSGYLLGNILIKNRDASSYFLPFYARRALRILPLYWILICVWYFVWSSSEPLWPIVLFLQNFQFAAGHPVPFAISPTWSLAVEEQFYLVLPFIVRFCPAAMLPRLVVVLILAALPIRAAFEALGNPMAAYVLLPPRMDTLFLGVLVAWAQQNNLLSKPAARALIRLTAYAGALALVALFLTRQSGNPFDGGLGVLSHTLIAILSAGAIALVASRGARMEDGPIVNALAPAGLGAYSLYLFHIPLLLAVQRIVGPSKIALIITVACLASIAVICWRVIERPAIALGHQLFAYRAEVPNEISAQAQVNA